MKKGLLVTTFISVCMFAQAGNWPGWRGPQGDGHSSEKELPVKWGAEQVKWTVDLKDPCGSTPAIWGDYIFLTATENKKNMVLCYDRKGRQRFRVDLGAAAKAKHGRYGSGSNPSPVTDGERVYVFFKNGAFAAIDFEGKVVWQKNIQKDYGADTLWWDIGNSPALTREHLIMSCIQSKPGPSYVAAFDKATGKEAWQTPREMNVNDESNQAYTSPLIVTHKGVEQIITLGADHLISHEAKSGKELWRCGGLNPTNHKYWRCIASPALAGDLVLAPYARGTNVTAVRLGGSGDVTKTHTAWVAKVGGDVPIPVVVGERVYSLSDKGHLSCLKLKTGEVVWTQRLEKHQKLFRSSPVVIDGNIYCTREDGKTFVVKAGDTYELLAANMINDDTMASLAVSDGLILQRGVKQLHCIAK